ncbi:ABC transporter permease [Cytobacillus spongiae]|jgi:acetoin utilization transport system permease protein|uniref:ABC transporter permease n=1 Tax=Cytobacillus spongiae TaxID=2901381 RepID=UPI001F375CF5|nr:ABC transporter permease [Cytobacillus spongiae]UII56031.1 ABC transporter permease [Cytobacillus spongiae]
MKLADQFRFVRQNMKKNRSRVFMTILATAMGCAFLIVLASVGFGLHKSIIQDITQDRAVTQIEVHGKMDENESYQSLKKEDIEQLEGIDHVKSVTRRQHLQQSGRYSIGEYEVYADTVVAHIPSEVTAGFELSEGRFPKKSSEIMVGYHFAQYLVKEHKEDENIYDDNTGKIKAEYGYHDSILGKELTLTVRQFEGGKEKTKEIPLTVVGVGKKPTREWFENQNAFISSEVLKEIEDFTGTSRGMLKDPSQGEESELFQLGEDTYDLVTVYAKDIEAVKDIVSTLDKQQFASYSVVSELENINKIFIVIKAGLIFIGAIAIIIASIGIYNTMTMAVTERAPDIGIMKAIGAHPSTIKKIFLLESSYIGIVGAIIGTIVSYGISFVVNFSLPLIVSQAFGEEPPEGLIFSYIPISLPLICIAICYIVTIISGMRPAKRATNVDVLKAMRREV